MRARLRSVSAAVSLLLVACAGRGHSGLPVPAVVEDIAAAPDRVTADDIDPFIGTGGHGHTFPGASVPFGLVQAGPDTRLDGWDGCSGFHRDDTTIYGFSHTHLSGTGCSDYGDILLQPRTGELRWSNGADGRPGYRSPVRPGTETASAGFYAVTLEDTGVRAEVTATERAGIHRWTFPEGAASPHAILDLVHRDLVLSSSVDIVSDREIRGRRASRAWAEDQQLFYAIRFAEPFESVTVRDAAETLPPGTGATGTELRAVVRFRPGTRVVVAAVALSSVDEAAAAANLAAEASRVPGEPADAFFDRHRTAARAAWEAQLAKIRVRGGTPSARRSFATAVYHACLAPNVFSDADGRSRGRDGRIRPADGRRHYTVFSLWDTFRALHPLLVLLEPERTGEFVHTFLLQERESGALPVWELWANETDCMIGYHSVPVIVDAYVKGIRGFDPEAALAASVRSAERDWRGISAYRESGYVPADVEAESVSKTLEYAYDDFCIAELARRLGKKEIAERFGERSQSWKNLFDPGTGFFRPRRRGAFVEPFDPAEVNIHLTEANSWQYSLFVPHDVDGLGRYLAHAGLPGGASGLEARLDALFSAPSKTTGRDQADITGLIGQYAHGNEPSHHMAWLYAFTPSPAKGQRIVRRILDELYRDTPDGLCGNEDCGQMSAWYVFSSLGFYPVTPGVPEYVVGAPLFDAADLHVGGGRTFRIRASGEGPYVASATLDGQPLERPVLPHAAVAAGGTLVVRRSPAPTSWGSAAPARQSDPAPAITPVPYVVPDATGAADAGVRLRSAESSGVRILWRPLSGPESGGTPGGSGALREAPAAGDGDGWIVPVRSFVAHAVRNGIPSRPLLVRIPRVRTDRGLTLGTEYAPQYAANGPLTLVDGLRGGRDYRTGEWQGFQGKDVVATVDLAAVRPVRAVRVSCLAEPRSWIWMPAEAVVETSRDGAQWVPFGSARPTADERRMDATTETLTVAGSAAADARFVRVRLVNRGPCPPWHPGSGHPSWIFADEIDVDPAPDAGDEADGARDSDGR